MFVKCNSECKRKESCALHCIHHQGHWPTKDYYDLGFGSVGSKEVLWFCGEHGKWMMYIPIEGYPDDLEVE